MARRKAAGKAKAATRSTPKPPPIRRPRPPLDPGFSGVPVNWNGKQFDLKHGDVVIAAITSCTNTSNPTVMVAAGLLAKKAVEKGLTVPPHVKTSLAPGSRVVTDYFEKPASTSTSNNSASTPSATAARPASATAARCPSRSPKPSRKTTWSSPACSPATATSKAASIPM